MIRKLLITAMMLVCVVGFSTQALAAIAGGPHDLSNDSLASGEICKYCHIPHNPLSITPYPLWNRSDTSANGTFTLYDGTTLASVSGSSAMCLSCHDGVTNLDAFGGSSGSPTSTISDIFSGTTANVGILLTDDHPIGAAAVYTAGAEFQGDITPLVLEGGRVECGTCHDPHTDNAKFLEIDNTGSALCLKCHIK